MRLSILFCLSRLPLLFWGSCIFIWLLEWVCQLLQRTALVLIRIAFNLSITLRMLAILTILSIPIYKYRISCHLFRFLKKFIQWYFPVFIVHVLHFFVQIYSCFTLFHTIVKQFLNKFSYSYYLVYRNAIDLGVLILYSALLLKSFKSPNTFSVNILGFSIYQITSSVIDTVLLLPFQYQYVLFIFLTWLLWIEPPVQCRQMARASRHSCLVSNCKVKYYLSAKNMMLHMYVS